MSDLRVGLIGGTGLGEALGAEAGTRHQKLDTPFGSASDAIIKAVGRRTVLLLSRHGPGHLFNPSRRALPCEHLRPQAIGLHAHHRIGGGRSLREEFRPGDLVIPDQIIDRTIQRDRTFYENAAVQSNSRNPFVRYCVESSVEASLAPRVSAAEDRKQGNIWLLAMRR